jgi:hypothetical protein
MQTVPVFSQPAVHCFGKPEITLDEREGVFNFTAHGRFAPLNPLLPVCAPFGHSPHAMVTAIDLILYH